MGRAGTQELGRSTGALKGHHWPMQGSRSQCRVRGAAETLYKTEPSTRVLSDQPLGERPEHMLRHSLGRTRPC